MAKVYDSSPGYPLCDVNNSNEYWLNEEWTYTKFMTISLLKNIGSLAELPAGKRGELENFVKVFIKNEPLSRKKVEQKRPRVIMGTSLVYQLASRVIYSNLLDAFVQSWKDTPISTGMGLSTPDQIREMYELLKDFDTSDDVSSWDWRMQHWLLSASVEVQLRVLAHFGASVFHLTVYGYLQALLASPVLAYSDGELVVLDEDGLIASGRLDTADLNSKAKSLLMKLVHFDPSLKTRTMGDDGIAKGGRLTVQGLKDRYEQLGYELSLAHVFLKTEIEFCSHLFDYANEKVVFLNSAKAVANYVSKKTPEPGVLLATVALSPDYEKILRIVKGEGLLIPDVYLRQVDSLQRWAERKTSTVHIQHVMAPPSGKSNPAKGKQPDKSKQKQAKDAASKRTVRAPSNKGAPGPIRDAYVSSYLSPTTRPGVKIPDEDTRPSSTFQTRRIYTVLARHTTGTTAREVIAIAPNLYNGIVQPGVNQSNGQMTLMMTSSPNLASGNSGAKVDQIFDTAMLSAIREVYSDVRPVTCEAAWTNTRAATSITGMVYAGSFGRGQWVSQIDDPANAGFPNYTLCGLVGSQSNGYSNFADLISACDYQAPAGESIAVRWIAQDQANRDYLPVPIGDDAFRASGPIMQTSLVTMIKENAFYLPFAALNEDLTDEINTYVVPVDWTAVDDPTTLGKYEVEETRAPLNNWIVLAIDATTINPGAEIGRIVITTNWEGIPRKAAGTIVSATPSVSNPMSLARAANIAAALPSVVNYTRPNAPENKSTQEIAKKMGVGEIFSSVANAMQAAGPAVNFLTTLAAL